MGNIPLMQLQRGKQFLQTKVSKDVVYGIDPLYEVRF